MRDLLRLPAEPGLSATFPVDPGLAAAQFGTDASQIVILSDHAKAFEKAAEESTGLSADTRRALGPHLDRMRSATEFVPLWVVVGVALALGIGTTVGYKRIVVTVAEKIGTTHLTYGQGAAAEVVAAATILGADVFHMPVSTTHVLSSGVAGTMAANGSGIQGGTAKKIALAWLLTLPAAMLLSGLFYLVGSQLAG